VSFDPNAHREASRENWEAAAAGWLRRGDEVDALAAPVAHWMLDAASLQPGQRVLELAAGLGETGLLAAELVAPSGSVIISDQAEAMLDGARARAAARGVENVTFKVLNAEWIDLPLASVEVVFCRWGYMLMADPAAALSETRRVLAPGGCLALAVWDTIERNPWAGVPGQELAERGLAPGGGGQEQGPRPGPFALGDAGRLRDLIDGAGFTEVTIDAIDLPRRHPDFEDFWQSTLDLSRVFHDAVLSRPEPEIGEIRAGVQRRLAPYTAADGEVAIPGRTLVARASA
jgi:SAM-dependent methyltransferase